MQQTLQWNCCEGGRDKKPREVEVVVLVVVRSAVVFLRRADCSARKISSPRGFPIKGKEPSSCFVSGTSLCVLVFFSTLLSQTFFHRHHPTNASAFMIGSPAKRVSVQVRTLADSYREFASSPRFLLSPRLFLRPARSAWSCMVVLHSRLTIPPS